MGGTDTAGGDDKIVILGHASRSLDTFVIQLCGLYRWDAHLVFVICNNFYPLPGGVSYQHERVTYSSMPRSKHICAKKLACQSKPL